MNLFFVSSNKGKIAEAKAILDIPLEIVTAELEEIQDLDLETIVRHKVQQAYDLVKQPVLVDDAGLFIQTWNGFPGPFIKYIHTSGGNELLLRMMSNEEDRQASFKAAIGFHDGKAIHTFLGEVKGSIALEKRGNNGWGFDPIFIPENTFKTFSEMNDQEKNNLSHRKRALEQVKQFIKGTNYVS